MSCRALTKKGIKCKRKILNGDYCNQHSNYSYSKRLAIPAAVRASVWNQYIGNTKGISKCFVGCGEKISRSNFECGHIVSCANGGKIIIDNLRPICGLCNKSMGTMNMIQFIETYGFKRQINKNKINDTLPQYNNLLKPTNDQSSNTTSFYNNLFNSNTTNSLNNDINRINKINNALPQYNNLLKPTNDQSSNTTSFYNNLFNSNTTNSLNNEMNRINKILKEQEEERKRIKLDFESLLLQTTKNCNNVSDEINRILGKK